jgi:hypothetical protein
MSAPKAGKILTINREEAQMDLSRNPALSDYHGDAGVSTIFNN